MSSVPRPRADEPIRLVFTKAGQARYRVRLDGDPHPNTGKRRQIWTTHDTLSAARDHVQAHKTDRQRGMLLAPDRQTFREYAEQWHATRARRVREITANAYRSCLNRAYAEFGSTPLRRVSRGHVERVIAGLADLGRTKRTASLTLFVIRSVFEDALHDGLIVRNPAARVEPLGAPSSGRKALSLGDLKRLRAHLVNDDLYGCWLLTLSGLRRSELLGLRWGDVDLTAMTLTISRSRVLVDGKRTVEGPPKTHKGYRKIFMAGDVVAALRDLRDKQAAELGFEHARTGYVAVDAVGRPIRPERWSDLWKAHCAAAGVPAVTLHAARHSSVTAMRNAGVPDHIVAAHHGHDEAVMRSVYSHGQDEQLAAAAQTLANAMSG